MARIARTAELSASAATPAAMRDLFMSNSTLAGGGGGGAPPAVAGASAAVATDVVWNGAPMMGADSSSVPATTSTSLRRAFLLLLSPLAFVSIVGVLWYVSASSTGWTPKSAEEAKLLRQPPRSSAGLSKEVEEELEDNARRRAVHPENHPSPALGAIGKPKAGTFGGKTTGF